MSSSPSNSVEKYEKYLEGLKWLCIAVAVVLAFVLNFSDVGKAVKYSLVLSIILAFFEAFWIGGIVVMGIGYGMSTWELRKVVMRPTELFAVIRTVKPSFPVWLGHYANWTAATTQGLVLIVAGLFFLPPYMKGVVLAGVIDLALTFLRCVPTQMLLNAASGKLKITPATLVDVPSLTDAQRQSWGDIDKVASEKMLVHRVQLLGDHLYVARGPGGEVVGSLTTILLPEGYFTELRSWAEITANGWCDTHDPNGEVVFGADMSKAPGLDGEVHGPLMLALMRRVIKENRPYVFWGGRMPTFYLHSYKMTAEEYLRQTDEQGRPLDPEVRMFVDVPGVEAVGVIPDYFPDPPSLNYGVLLRWTNPFCSRTNKRWWRIFVSNQLVRNILAFAIPRVAAAAETYSGWRAKRHRNRRPSL